MNQVKKVAVDTGFIVCNDWTYPNLHKMFKKLKVAVRDTDMSFGFADEKTGYCYSGKNVNGLFAQRKNIFNPRFWLLLKEVVRFNNYAKADLAKGIDLSDTTMRDYLSSYSFSKHFILDYLVPIGGAIWSSSNKTMLDFPADLFLHFFKNHLAACILIYLTIPQANFQLKVPRLAQILAGCCLLRLSFAKEQFRQ